MKLILMNINNDKPKGFESWNKLSDVQKAGIESAIYQLDQKKGINHKTVMKELKQKYKIKL
jgi:hypothetical protein